MATFRLRYVVEDTDRHGNIRLYFRRRGQPKIRLPSIPGSEEFMSAYRDALSRLTDTSKLHRRLQTGTFGHLCRQYFASPSFKGLDESTRNWRRRALNEIAVAHGDKPVAKMQARHVRQLRDEKADKPGASRNRLKALRALFRWAIENDQSPHDPTRDIKPIRHVTKGHHAWTSEEIGAFEDKHPLGSKARLAMTLLLYTACRREDVVRLGPQHISRGRLQYRQAKNEHRNPVDLDIPVHADLAKAIAETPSRHLTFLVTEYGKPFSVAGFGGKFREWCNQAGLRHCSAHGLRKATASRLAERGASPHEIMAITGHRSLEEVERYTRTARKAQLADSAMAKLK
ncbi:MAG: tyrosine-type recombinase/integrase [Pseudolabrys sp.]|nr:tyrosine-type recombinase/integrase [Pseudolabrys sp.]